MDGVKWDRDKPKWYLLPFEEVEDIVRVMTFGAEKYEPDNWMRVPDATNRYFDALMRHIAAWKKGELVDPETGITHLAHAGFNILCLMWFDKQGGEDDQFRGSRGSAPGTG